MSLSQIRNRKFDDILYSGVKRYPWGKPLPIELTMTDEVFLRRTFELYCLLEKEHTVILRQKKKKNGVTTAMCFIIAYYSLQHPVITIVEKPGSCWKQMVHVYEMFAEFAGFSYSIDKKTGQAFFKHNGNLYCTINFFGDGFDIANLTGVVIFNDCNKMSNISKYSDLMLNGKKYDKLILNFPQNKEIDKLAEDYNLKIKEIQIF